MWCNIPEDYETSTTPCENLKFQIPSYLYYERKPPKLDASGRQT
jgi:hypothetical protein